MNKEPLTHSETYLKKTNRIILTVGIASLLIFIFGLALLLLSNDTTVEYEAPNFTDNDDALNIAERQETTAGGIEFGNIIEDEIPLTTTPDPVPLGQVVIGTDAKNVLTLGNQRAWFGTDTFRNVGRPSCGRFCFYRRLFGCDIAR